MRAVPVSVFAGVCVYVYCRCVPVHFSCVSADIDFRLLRSLASFLYATVAPGLCDTRLSCFIILSFRSSCNVSIGIHCNVPLPFTADTISKARPLNNAKRS